LPNDACQIVENGLAMQQQAIEDGVNYAAILGNDAEDTPLHCGSLTVEGGKGCTSTILAASLFSFVSC
jgi:hypothetical protein